MTDATRHRRTVSVVIPCYNAREFVTETLESVLAQTYPWVDVVVVDDGSTDGSWEIVEGFGRGVRAFRKENGGPARARNHGAEQALGEAMLFLDADDLIAPDTLGGLTEALAERDDMIAACPWSRLVKRDGAWTVEPAEVPFPLTDPDPLAAWLKGEWIAGCSLLWPKALFDRLGGYDTTLTADEDGDLMYRALLGGSRLVVATRGESFYRAHDASRVSVSQDVFADHRFRSRMRVFEKVEEELRRAGRWERYRSAVGLAYHGLAQRTFAARPDLAAEALARGTEYAGHQAVAPTLPGRILVRLLGMGGKERVVNALARVGIMSRDRRRILARGALAGAHPEPAPAPRDEP